jgi:hypothetical protein
MRIYNTLNLAFVSLFSSTKNVHKPVNTIHDASLNTAQIIPWFEIQLLYQIMRSAVSTGLQAYRCLPATTVFTSSRRCEPIMNPLMRPCGVRVCVATMATTLVLALSINIVVNSCEVLEIESPDHTCLEKH